MFVTKCSCIPMLFVDPTCGRGDLIKINETTSVCCERTQLWSQSDVDKVPYIDPPNTTTQCQRAGKNVTFNVTTKPGCTITGTYLRSDSLASKEQCLESCCNDPDCKAYTWWADTPSSSDRCHHGHPCCVLTSSVVKIVPNAPVCPPNPGAHDACAISGILTSRNPPSPSPSPRPTPPKSCAEADLGRRPCLHFPPPCLMGPLPSTAQICCTWQDWASCDALTTSAPCPTVSCVANVSCPAGPADWCSKEWGNVRARGWCTGFCETFAATDSRPDMMGAKKLTPSNLWVRDSSSSVPSLASPSTPPPFSHCVLPPTRHLNFSTTCTEQSAVASAGISWAAQRGEFESAQILIVPASAGLGELGVVFSDLVSPSGQRIDRSLLSWRQQGYVFVRHTSRYADSGCPGLNSDGSCWRPDPLLNPGNGADNQSQTITLPTEEGRSQPLWISIAVPRTTTPMPQHGEYRGHLSLLLNDVPIATVSISLEVWNVTVPTTAEASVTHDWHFSSSRLAPFYPSRPLDAVAEQWWRFMEAHRLPPIDSNAWNPPLNANTSFLSHKTAMLEASLHRNGCNCSSCPEAQARANAEHMRDAVTAARANVPGAQLFLYAFDERPKSCEGSIRTAFDAVLDAFPAASDPQARYTFLSQPNQSVRMG